MADIFDLFRQIAKEKDGAPKAPVQWIVAGLGNPERKYDGTRHNVGFTFVDYACGKYGFRVDKEKFQALTGEATIAGERVLFLKPLTYMNNSGQALRDAAEFYKIPPERILVVFDDVSLEPGKLRIRRSGSAGGHNGIKSIIYHLRSENFPRIKIGVGKKPHPEYDLADWVLGRFPESDGKAVSDAIRLSAQAMELILHGDTETAMCRYNG